VSRTTERRTERRTGRLSDRRDRPRIRGAGRHAEHGTVRAVRRAAGARVL